MAYNFFGVYFEDALGVEYRCGFHDDNGYMPIIERRANIGWVEVNQQHGPGNAKATCQTIRTNLPVTIPFADNHTQNERMELINQLIFNLNRKTTQRVNYQGAHD